MGGEGRLRFSLASIGALAANFLPGHIPEDAEIALSTMDGVHTGDSVPDIRMMEWQGAAKEVRVLLAARGEVKNVAEMFRVCVDISVPQTVLNALENYGKKEVRRLSSGSGVRRELDKTNPISSRLRIGLFHLDIELCFLLQCTAWLFLKL